MKWKGRRRSTRVNDLRPRGPSPTGVALRNAVTKYQAARGKISDIKTPYRTDNVQNTFRKKKKK